jgi:hypothetical protein
VNFVKNSNLNEKLLKYHVDKLEKKGTVMVPWYKLCMDINKMYNICHLSITKIPNFFFSFIKNISSIFFIWSIVILYLYNSNQKPSLLCLCSTKKFTILHVKHACRIASCSRLTFIKSMVEKYDVPRNPICFTLFLNNCNIFIIIHKTFLLIFFSKK